MFRTLIDCMCVTTPDLSKDRSVEIRVQILNLIHYYKLVNSMFAIKTAARDAR